MTVRVAVVLAGLALGACAAPSPLTFDATLGASPTLPPPQRSIVPIVQVPKATGWPSGVLPVAAEGLRVNAFATGLHHPRWIHVLRNGDVLVAETAAPPRPEQAQGVKAFFMRLFMKRAGSAVESANRITLLRDADGDGVAETRSVLVGGLHSPFGMARVGGSLYVANTDAILRFPYRDGDVRIDAAPTQVTDLPAGPRNHHWTKNIIASPDGSRLYATVGSNSNAGEHGLHEEEGRAAIWVVDLATGTKRPFATGLRNPNGLAFDARGTLWTVVNERDELGNDLVPDYLTSVADGGFYGWPYSYFGAHVDPRVKPQRPDRVARARVPDYALGSHVAALGLAHSHGTKLPARYAEGMFVGEHGSWNRRPPVGYAVVFVPFVDGMPSGAPLPVLTGFLSHDGEAYGRPVGVAIDRGGALLVADDVGNVIWRVSAAH